MKYAYVRFSTKEQKEDRQLNKFFTFISDTYQTTSLVFTTNKEVADWAEMMGDPVLTTALLDRILGHAIGACLFPETKQINIHQC